MKRAIFDIDIPANGQPFTPPSAAETARMRAGIEAVKAGHLPTPVPRGTPPLTRAQVLHLRGTLCAPNPPESNVVLIDARDLDALLTFAENHLP